MKKIFRKIHLWLSIPFGVIITLICFSGAMLVFEDDIMRLINHDLYYVEQVGKETIPLEQLASRVAADLPEGVAVSGITAYPDAKRCYRVNLSKPKRAAVYIDPYTGKITGYYQRSPFFKTMFSLHRWLLGSRPEGEKIFWGKTIVGTSTLLFVLVLLSGIVIWWPRGKKNLKKRLSISIRKGLPRFWYDLHVAGGMYALVVMLAMALTGLTWSFDWYRSAFYTAFGVELPAGSGHGAPPAKQSSRPAGNTGNRAEGQKASRREKEFAGWQQVYERLAKENPSHLQITLSNGNAQVSNNRMGNTRGTDRYTFDPRSGEITGVTRYKDAEKAGKMRGWIYAIHVGSWGGITTRIIWFLTALLGASLPLTGYYLWIKRLYRRSSSGKRS